jgi:hypothetical protein
MKNFASLLDGTLFNLNAIAFVGIELLPDGYGQGGIVSKLRVVLFPLADGASGP